MTDPQRFAIIPLPAGGPAPAEAIVVGDLDAVMRYLPQTVAAEELEQCALDLATRVQAREQALTDGLHKLAPSIGHFMDVCGRLVEGAEAQRAEQVRQDAARKARRDAERVRKLLDDLPDPDAALEPTPRDGDLSVLGPPDQLRFAPDQGALPNELQAGAPPLSGTYPEPDPAELGGPKDPKQVPQPIAISLNEKDD